jgi:hypothetical protein
LLLVALTVLIGLGFVASVLHLSALRGRLAMPLTYDDIVYFIDGFDLFERQFKTGVASLIRPTLYMHAPFQSLLALTGYHLFGLNDWSGYQVNGLLLIGFLISVLWLTKPLDLMSRIAILVLVLMTPFTANLVAEFRPDLFWGVLCGFAVYLLLRPNLFDANWTGRSVTLIVTVAAVYAKPSAFPATALIVGTAFLAAVVLRLSYRPLTRRELAVRAGFPLIAGALLAAPYFVTNAFTLYNYIYKAYVTLGDLNTYRAPIWDHAFYFSTGTCYRTALFFALWIGLAAFAANIIQLLWSGRREDLVYYSCYAGVVLVAYLIPTLSPVKSYYLGGIFYGTFLVFTIASLVALFQAITSRLARYTLGAALAGLALFTAPGVPLATKVDPKDAADWRAAYDQMVAAIVKDVAHSSVSSGVAASGTPLVVYTSSPGVNAQTISIILRWEGISVRPDTSYYTRTLQTLEKQLLRSDYAILSDFHDESYPGWILTPQLLEFAMKQAEFETISTYTHPSGMRIYLLKHNKADIRRGNN